MENKIIKFKDYKQANEATFTVSDEGKMVLADYEMYKDWHPKKFKSLGACLYDSCEFVWIIKFKDNIIGTFSDTISEQNIHEVFKAIQSSNS